MFVHLKYVHLKYYLEYVNTLDSSDFYIVMSKQF